MVCPPALCRFGAPRSSEARLLAQRSSFLAASRTRGKNRPVPPRAGRLARWLDPAGGLHTIPSPFRHHKSKREVSKLAHSIDQSPEAHAHSVLRNFTLADHHAPQPAAEIWVASFYGCCQLVCCRSLGASLPERETD